MKTFVPKSGVFAIVFLIVNLFCKMAVSALGQVTQTFSYTGSNQTFIVPAGVTSITVEVWGGGGGGGGRGSGTGATSLGGGGGAYARSVISGSLAASYIVVVGNGGQAVQLVTIRE